MVEIGPAGDGWSQEMPRGLFGRTRAASRRGEPEIHSRARSNTTRSPQPGGGSGTPIPGGRWGRFVRVGLSMPIRDLWSHPADGSSLGPGSSSPGRLCGTKRILEPAEAVRGTGCCLGWGLSWGGWIRGMWLCAGSGGPQGAGAALSVAAAQLFAGLW